MLFRSVDSDVVVKLYNIAKNDENDMIVDVFKSKTVIMGSPTIGNNILHSMAGFIHLIKIMKFKKKKAAAFGCYGWSGESVKVLNGLMKDAGFEVVDEGYRNQWNPTADAEIQGEVDKIEYIIDFMKSLKRARVESVDIVDVEVITQEDGFIILK